MLDRIHAKNFRCYRELDLDLTSHKVHCFYGPHGAGKSSIAMAVEVALTGKVAGVKDFQDMAEMIKDGAKSWTVDAHGAGEHAKRHRTRTAAARPVGYPWMSDNMAHAVFGPNQHILSMDSKVRRAFFYDALGVQVTAAGIKNRLGARGVDDTLAKGFAESAAEIGFKQAEGIAVDERRIAGRKRDEAEALKSSPSPVGWLGDLSKVDREELFAEIHTMADRRDVVLKKIGASEERELVDLGKLRASEEELQANIIVQEQLADPGVKDALDNDKAGHLGQIEFHRGNITNINDQIRQTNARVKIKRDAHQKFDKERRDHTDTLKEGMAKIIMVLDSAQSDHECPIYRKPCPADKVALVNAKALEHHRATIEADISAAANKVQASEDDLKVVIRSGKEEADGLREKQDPINAKIIDLQEQVNGIDVKLGAHRQAVTDLSDLKARIASVQIQIAKGEAQAKETVEDIDKLQVERDELDAKITARRQFADLHQEYRDGCETAKKAQAKYRTACADWEDYDKIQKAFSPGPDGIMAEILAEKLDPVRKQIEAFSALVPGRIQLDDECDIEYNYRPAIEPYCSKSEAYRIEVIIRAALSIESGAGVICVDEATFLLHDERNALLEALANCPLKRVLWISSRDERPDAFHSGDIRQWWVEAGLVEAINGQ